MSIHRWTKLLRRLGVEDPEATALELTAEEAERKKRGQGTRLWGLHQTVALVSYGLRDRMLRASEPRPWNGLKPVQALEVAWRSIRRDAGTALTGAATLAVGFGAAATIFAVWEGFSRPLPVPEGRDIVQIQFQDQQRRKVSPTWAQARDGRLRGLSAQGAYAHWDPVVRPSRGTPRRASGARISQGGLEALGVRPIVGRLPQPGAWGAVLVNAEGWSRLAMPGTPTSEAPGTAIQVDGTPMTVVGVMPPGFGFPLNQDFWALLGPADQDQPVELFGRLGPEVTLQAATLEVMTRMAPDVAPGGTAQVLGFTDGRGESGESTILLAVLGLVLVLVLVSCSNVSNLLLIRGLDRSNQLAVHQAMGASPPQVGWLVLTESTLIAAVGAAGGALMAWLAIGFIQGSLAGHWGYHWMDVAFRPSTALFLVGLAGLTSLVAGLVPAVRALRADVRGGLTARQSHGNTCGLGWIGPTLLTAQVSLSFLFLLTAVLIGRGLWASRAINPAFPAEEVYLTGVQRPEAQAGEERWAFAEALERSIRAQRGVTHAALATGVPGYRSPLRRMAGASDGNGSDPQGGVIAATAVTPGFFDLFGIRTLRGRPLEPGDLAPDGPKVAVVSRALAEDRFGTLDAVGLHLPLSPLGSEGSPESFEVVGVVDDVRIYADQPRGRPVYLPLSRDDNRSIFLLFRGDGLEPDAADAAASRALAGVDPEIPMERAPGAGETGTVADVLGYIRTLYSTAGLLGMMGGGAAVVVALLGLYGILSYQMRRRRRELGIRVALGAGRRSVLSRVLGLGLRSLAPGLLLGAVAALASLPLLGVLLGSGRARDGALLVAVALAYALVGVVASLPPAVRASRTDPNLILRED